MADDVQAIAAVHFKKLSDHRWVWADCRNLRLVWRMWRRHRKRSYWKKLRGYYLVGAYKPWSRKLDVQLIRVLSPTRAIADYLKHMIPACEALRRRVELDSPEDKTLRARWRGRVLKAMNFGYRIVSLLILLVLALFGSCVWWPVWLPLVYYGFSRANEVLYAFGRDALRIAKRELPSSDLGHDERIKLALWSYISLLVDFGIMYYVLRNGFDLKQVAEEYVNPVASIWSAIYFSGVTMVTLGYGDIAPSSFFVRVLALYQVACGIALLVLSFALYVGTEPKKENQEGNKAVHQMPS